MAEIHGFTDARFAALKGIMSASIDAGTDIGACFAATVDGEMVADIWGGWTDDSKATPWAEDTIVNVYSTTKTMCALTALFLADRGELDFDKPVAHYWPEFAANGKAAIKVSHLMSHSAGLSGWKEPIDKTVLYDWDKACALLAAQAPFWEAGTASGYHALTQGYLVGEVVRRIAGRSLGNVFRTEIAEPLGADFQIGLPASEDVRVATLIPPPVGGTIADFSSSELTHNMATNPSVDPSETRTRAWRAAEIPAANGHGNARSVAKIHTLLANGGMAQGKRIMSEAGCRKALELQVEGTDLCLGMPIRFGLGFGLQGSMMPLPSPGCMFWGGYGGSLALIDMDKHVSMAFAMNRMESTTVGDTRAFMLAMTVWGAVAT